MICTKCGKDKPEEKFHWNKKGVRRERDCADCANKRFRLWAKKNKPPTTKKNTKGFPGRNKIALYGWLAGQECSRCGEAEMLLLDLHHRNPDEKEMSIARAARDGCNLERMWREVAKCDVLCVSCHRREHFEIVDGIRAIRPTGQLANRPRLK